MTIYSNLEKTPNNTSLLFVLFGIWSFILICRPQDYLSFLGYIRPGLSLGILTLITYCFSRNAIINYSFSRQLKLYLFMVLTMIWSIPFSYYRRASLMDFITYASVVMFFFLFYRIVTSINKLKILLFIYCIGISVYTLYIFNYGRLTEDRVSFGEMFDPNDIAFFIISFLVFNLLFISKQNQIFIRIISFANIILGIIVLLKTGSRGSFLALICVIAYLFIAKNRIINISLFSKIIVMAIAIFSLQYVSINSERYETILNLRSDYNVTGEGGRIEIWGIGMKVMLTHPFTGIGFNRFPEAVGHYYEMRGMISPRWLTAHNSLVQIGGETGVIGFILFSILSFNSLKIFGEVANKSHSEALCKMGDVGKAGFIGMFVSAMFLSQAYSVYWAFYIVLSAVLKYLLDNEINRNVSVS